MKHLLLSLICALTFSTPFPFLLAENSQANSRESSVTENASTTAAYALELTQKPLSYAELLTRANDAARQKNYTESITLFDRATAVDPDRVEALFNCGIIHLRLEKPDHARALAYFDRALIVTPTHAKALHYRAKSLTTLGRKEEAFAAYEKALRYNTSNVELINEYAQLCSDNAQYQRAADLYEMSNNLAPRDQTILSLGNTYNMLNDMEKALACYKKLEEKNPSSVSALYNIAYTLKKLGRLTEAFPYYQKVLSLEPGHPDAHFGIGLSYLITGDFENGFREYEWRWARDKKNKRSPKTPEWDGCVTLEGKTVLLIAEQGLGDTFQFIRYGKVLQEKYGAHVVAAVQKPLVTLLSLCPYLEKVVSLADPLPLHDYHAHTVSMPYLCKTTRMTTPTPIPYIHASEELVEFWRNKMADDKNFKVGICWQGNPNYSTQFLRSVVAAKSITLTKLLPLFTVPGVSFYNLQKMTGEEQLKLLPESTPLISFGNDFDNEHGRFMDTAAVMKNLDLMITVDTGTAHIAAALGVPTWTFIPEPPDWRWMLHCDDTPWYPNMRLFRQPSIGDWETTIATVCHELEKLVHERRA